MIRFVPGLLFLIAMFAVVSFGQKDIAADAVKTTVIDADALRALVKEPETKQPILINFWATWCGPCRAEFPELVAIDNEFREKGLAFYLVSIDNVGLADTGVSDFLKDYGARMPSYLLDAEERRDITRAIRAIAPAYRDGIPTTLLFNRDGHLVFQKSGVVNGRLLRRAIRRVVK